MNLSDYYLSISNDTNCSSASGTYGKCLTGWMHLSQNDSQPLFSNEWTMTRYGWAFTWANYGSFVIGENGSVSNWSFTAILSIRPVFFLKNNISLIDGSGTETDPFII